MTSLTYDIFALNIARNQREILLAYATFAQADGTGARPSKSTIAKMVDYSLRHVNRLVKSLEENGLLKAVKYEKGKPTTYDITVSGVGRKDLPTYDTQMSYHTNQEVGHPDVISHSQPMTPERHTTYDTQMSYKIDRLKDDGLIEKNLSIDQGIKDLYVRVCRITKFDKTHIMRLRLACDKYTDQSVYEALLKSDGTRNPWSYAQKILENGAADSEQSPENGQGREQPILLPQSDPNTIVLSPGTRDVSKEWGKVSA